MRSFLWLRVSLLLNWWTNNLEQSNVVWSRSYCHFANINIQNRLNKSVSEFSPLTVTNFVFRWTQITNAVFIYTFKTYFVRGKMLTTKLRLTFHYTILDISDNPGLAVSCIHLFICYTLWILSFVLRNRIIHLFLQCILHSFGLSAPPIWFEQYTKFDNLEYPFFSHDQVILL